MDTIQNRIADFVKTEKERDQKRRELEKRINFRRAQITRLEKRLEKIPRSYWKDDLMRPLVDAIGAAMPGYRVEMLGPAGLRARIMIVAYPGESDDIMESLTVDFMPEISTDENGEFSFTLYMIDYETNTGDYEPGTLGEMNGMNYPRVPLPEDFTIDDLVAMLKASKLPEQNYQVE